MKNTFQHQIILSHGVQRLRKLQSGIENDNWEEIQTHKCSVGFLWISVFLVSEIINNKVQQTQYYNDKLKVFFNWLPQQLQCMSLARVFQHFSHPFLFLILRILVFDFGSFMKCLHGIIGQVVLFLLSVLVHICLMGLC